MVDVRAGRFAGSPAELRIPVDLNPLETIAVSPLSRDFSLGTPVKANNLASRAQPTPLSEWWRTVDRLTLAALGALMLGGIVLVPRREPAGRRAHRP